MEFIDGHDSSQGTGSTENKIFTKIKADFFVKIPMNNVNPSVTVRTTFIKWRLNKSERQTNIDLYLVNMLQKYWDIK